MTASAIRPGIAGRFFLVGCERSGTTLLQAMLAQHSRIFTFQESHVFCRIVPRRTLYRRLGVANWKTAAPVIRELAERCLGLEGDNLRFPTRSPWVRTYATAFSRLIDASTVGAGKDIWLEKTPHHLYQVKAIARLVPNARFIHIIRDGRDVAASIRDASRTDPGYWGEWSVQRLADHWNQAVHESLGYQGRPEHHLVRYEALITDTETQLAELCGFMEIAPEQAMLRHWEAAERVTGWMGSRPWMDKAHQPVQDTRLRKYYEVFSPAERAYLDRRLIHGGQVEIATGSSGDPIAQGVG